MRHGNSHCTIQTSDSVIVVTGGDWSYNYVTRYQLDHGGETALTPLRRGRMDHACGVYQDGSGQQVSERGMLVDFVGGYHIIVNLGSASHWGGL